MNRRVVGRIDLRADHVGRQHVRRELDATELGRDRGSQRLHRECLRQARHALEQHMAVGQQADQQPFDQVVLAHHHVADFLNQGPRKDACLPDPLADRVNIHAHRIE